MTQQNFLDDFFVEFDKVASLANPGYDLIDISNIATRAQESLVIEKWTPNSNRLKEGFEETEKRIQEIGELVRYKSITTFTPGFLTNGVDVILPNSLIDIGPTNFSDVYWFTIFEEAITDQLDCTIANNTTTYVTATVVEVSHDQFKLATKNPFRKPFLKGSEAKVFRLRSENRTHQLITDGTFNITNYRLGYIRKPTPINITTLTLTNPISELSDNFHRELLYKTVEMAKASVQDPSLATNLQTIKE